MSHNHSLLNVLIANGIKVNETLAAEIAELDAEEDGGERRPIMAPEKLSEHLEQWRKVPRANPRNILNLPASAPPKASRPNTGNQGADKDDTTTVPTGIPLLTVTAPDPKRPKVTRSFNPEVMDDFLLEISKWAEASQSQPADKGADR